MRSFLINGIELFSNYKSFSLGVDTTRNLWILLHFNDLEIKNKTIYYQIDNDITQRKNTKYPVRKMQKKHKNTAELLKYLNDKNYIIHHLELEFTNGWRIKQRPFIELRFFTNSVVERDKLIVKLLDIAGQGPIDISALDINYSYYFDSHKNLLKIDIDGLPSPDEFWSEEKLKQWKIQYNRLENRE